MLPPLLPLLWQLSLAPSLATATAPGPTLVPSDQAVEVLPRPPIGALEEQMSGELAIHYAAAIAAIVDGQHRRALSATKQARALAYRSLRRGPTPLTLSRRHFTRVVHLEEQLSELTLVEEQLDHPRDREVKRSYLLQLKAILLHNLFLAVRGFYGTATATGRSSPLHEGRLLTQSLAAYKLALEDADALRPALVVGYAALLAESGRRREASHLYFSKLSDSEREQESLDVAAAYFYLALGDRSRAISRLTTAARRESWQHGSGGESVRSQVYRSSDFDLLRDHPRFRELVTTPEES